MNFGRLVGFALAGLSACGSKGGSTTGSSSASPSAATSASSAAQTPSEAGPWSVAIDSKNPLVLGALDGGIAVTDGSGVHFAVASADAKLEERPAPMGFASDVTRVIRVQGRAPGALWVTAEGAVPEGKKSPRTRFYRLERNKLKQISDDWNPLVVPWSKKRVLVMSTSSERLKVRVLEPYTKKFVDDQPSVHFPTPECAKSIQLAEAVSLPNGEVVGAGKCKMAGMKQPEYVALRWAAAAPPASASSGAASAAPSAAAAPAASAAPEASAAPDASGAPEAKPEEDEKRGAPMMVVVVTSNHVQHRRIAVSPTGAVYFAASGDGAGESYLFAISADGASKADLPKLEGPLLDIAFSGGGDLFAITRETAWRKPANGDWTLVSPSNGIALARLAPAGDVMFAAGARDSSKEGAKDAPGVLLRFGAGDPALQWQ